MRSGQKEGGEFGVDEWGWLKEEEGESEELVEEEGDLGEYMNVEVEQLSEGNSVFDYYYDIQECRWKEWLEYQDIDHPISNSLHLSM